MKEHPIPLKAWEVRAILDGRKTQTRRVVKDFVEARETIIRSEEGNWLVGRLRDSENAWRDIKCPFGQPGDRLWVRETFAEHRIGNSFGRKGYVDDYFYRADFIGGRFRNFVEEKITWKPSIHMPREASRLTLEITSVRVERLQEISHKDALAEGVEYDVSTGGGAPCAVFKRAWNRIYKRDGSMWESNPWVWVIEFRKAEGKTKIGG